MLGRARLVTITGLPGVGKTAAGLAAAVRADFAGGAWLVTLDSLHDGDMLPHTIAGALGIRDGPASCRLEALVDELSGRRLLLVLDTCEHLIGACAGFATALLLTPGRDLRILATSRESLRVPGGLTVTIRPLPLRYATELFGKRAAEAAPGFRITQENRGTVEAVCRRLDRLPLAIELAARQMASGSLEQLHSRLQAGYGFLRNAEDAPPRHESLHTAIGWSHQLCSPAERLLWARLSVFGGPFRQQDALDVCADTYLPRAAVATAVAMLAARSILVTGQDGNKQTWYQLPATVRAYGAGMLRRLGDSGEWERRHQAWRAAQRGRAEDAGEPGS
jgi:predicted ATPase